jgi:hypothetical protein
MTSLDPDLWQLLSRLAEKQEEALGDDLLGSNVFGSAATGDFEADISGLDTVTALRSDPTPDQLIALGTLHDGIVEDLPRWKDLSKSSTCPHARSRRSARCRRQQLGSLRASRSTRSRSTAVS